MTNNAEEMKNPNVSPMEKTNSVFTLNDFNSKTTLTEKGKLSNDYDIAAHRDEKNGTTSSGALAHLLKSSLGTGILAMPLAFSNAGLLFGMIGTIAIGLLCTHCVHILVKCSQSICKDLNTPALDFSETAQKVFEYGPKPMRRWANFAKQFVDGALMATYFAASIVYLLFIATSFHSVINDLYNLNWDIRIYIAIFIVPCLFLGQIRHLKYLVPFSVVANLLIILTFSITLYYMFNEPLVFSDKPLIAKATQIPLFFATAIFAMEGIGTVMPVENSMKRPQDFLGCPGVLNIAMATVVSLYAIIGFFGYVRFGDEVGGSITLNLPAGEPLADATKILMALAILFTYGLQFYVPNDILWKKIRHNFHPDNHNIAQIVQRTSITLLAGGIGAAAPNLEPFISLTGAVFFSLLGIFVPSVVETVYLWPDKLGQFRWRLSKNVILACLAIFALVSGSAASIQEIIEIYA